MDNHSEMVQHYEQMGYTVKEDQPLALKTLLSIPVLGIGEYCVTIENGIPRCGGGKL